MAWTPPSDAVETAATPASKPWTPPSDAVLTPTNPAPASGVMGGDDMFAPITEATAAKKPVSVLENAPAAPLPTEDKMLRPEFVQGIQSKLDAMPEAQRKVALAKMAQRPDAYGRAAKVIAGRYESLGQIVSPTLQNFDPRFEARKAKLVEQGLRPDIAEGYAQQGALQGTPQENLAQATEAPPEYAEAEPYRVKNNLTGIKEFGQTVTRGGLKAGLAYEQGVRGVNQFVGDTLGFDMSTNKARLDSINQFTKAMGEQSSKPLNLIEGAITSIGQQAPALIGGALTGSEPAVLTAMFAQSFGQTYDEGKRKGLDAVDNTARSAMYAALEVLGEKFGLGDKIKALKASANGLPSDKIASFFAKALVKEVPGEELTYAGQFAVDKGYGMNPEAGIADFISGAADTLAATVIQTGLMAGAGVATGKGVNKLQEVRDKIQAEQRQAYKRESNEDYARLLAQSKGFLVPESKAWTPPADAVETDLGEVGKVVPGEDKATIEAPKPPAATNLDRERRVKELADQIEASGVPPEDAIEIAKNRIAQAEEKQEKLGAKVPKTAAPINRAEELTQELIDAGVSPKEAKERATAIAKQEAEDDAEAESAAGTTVSGKTVAGTDRTGTAVVEQPGEAPATAGTEATEPGAVVSTGAATTGTAVGEESKPAAVTEVTAPKKELDQQQVEAMTDAELEANIYNTKLKDREWNLVKAEQDKRKAPPVVEEEKPPAAKAPITVVETKTTRGDPLTGPSTKVKLSDGSEHEINRLDTTTSMGLPGWHDVNKSVTEFSFLGNTKTEAIQELIHRQERKAESQTKEGTPNGNEATETQQTEAQGQEAPATGKPKTAVETAADQAREAIKETKKRGRPTLVLTPEQEVAKAAERKKARADYQRATRAADKHTTALEHAVAQANQTNRRIAYKELLKLEAQVRGTELGKRIKATLETNRNRFAAAEIDAIKREIADEKAKALPSVGGTVAAADPKFSKFTNAAQAVAHIIKTGDGFQQELAKRIRGFTNGVKFVVLEKDSPVPEFLKSGKTAKKWATARGMYVPGQKTIYIRGASFGTGQGVNNVVVLHELLHAATFQKLKLGQTALRQGFSPNNAVTLATLELQRVMDSARARFEEMAAAGELPAYIAELQKQANVFGNLDEFLAYGMSDNAMQTFLLGAKGREGGTHFFSRFVNSIRNYFGMNKDSVNALSDLILVTDKLLSARRSPTMMFLEAADKRAAAKENKVLLANDLTGTETRVRPSANVGRLAKMLGSKLYGTPDDIAKVSVKELFQNSFDAIKEAIEKGQLTKGKIAIKADEKTRSISIIDNGPGMPTSVMGNQFLQIAGTVKGTSRASGGLGVAKMLFLFENKQLEVVSLRDGVVSRMVTTGEDLKAALDNPDRSPTITTSSDPATVERFKNSLFPDGHGTAITIQIPETYKDESTGEDKDIRFSTYSLKASDVLKNSPLFDNIDVTFDSGYGPETLELGSNFPIKDYTPFANVRFAWGTARIYVTKEKLKDVWGDNAHILSNGLWQFGRKIKDAPGWDGKLIKRNFYIDVSPDASVKPEDAGYPFDLNRQNFSKAADADFSKIFNYITALYRQVDFSSEVKNFGTVQYINADGTLSKAESLEPKAPPTDNAFTLIKPGDKVEVRDGVLYVNNRKLPELTNDDLKNTTLRVDELTIPQDQIDPSKVMVHDNMEIPKIVNTNGLGSDARLTKLEETDTKKYKYDYDLSTDKYSFTITNPDGSTTTYTAVDPNYIASDLEDAGILPTTPNQGTTLSENARAKFGKRYDTYLHTIGSVFHQLRDALVRADTRYESPNKVGGAKLSEIGIGVSLDNEYYGVSTILPFEAMFINPATTDLKGTPKQIAVSLLGTMQHELAHYKIRSHDANFASEMQRVINLLDTYPGIDMQKIKDKLTSFIQDNNDIFTYLDGEFRSGNYKPTGNRLQDAGSYQARNEGTPESVESLSRAGEERGRSLSAITQSGAPNAGQVGIGAANVSEDEESGAERSQKQLDKDVAVAEQKVATSKTSEELSKAVSLLQLARNPKKIIPQLQMLWKTASYAQRVALTKLPTMDFLVNWANRAVPELRNTYELMQKMSGMTQQILKSSGILTTDVHRAFLADSSLKAKLENIALVSTIAQVDPSDPTAKLRSAKLDTAYAQLGREGQELYKRIKRHFENLSDLYSKLLDDQIKNSSLTPEQKQNLMVKLREMYETGRKITPYFPLVRRGDFWLGIGSGKNRQFYMYESLAERDRAMQEIADKSMYRKPNESLAAFEQRKKDNLAELIQDGNYQIGNDIHSLRRVSFDSSLLLRGVFDSIDSANLGDVDAKEALKDAIYQMYLNTMPEQSFRNQFINRKNTTGFSTDLVRNVSATSVKMATQLARIKYAPLIRNSLSAARDSTQGQPENEPFVTEMDRRAAKALGSHIDTTADNVASVFNKASFFFYLGGASSALLQPISVFQTGMPVLAGRYGVVNANREMAKMLKFWSQYGVYRQNADGTKSWVAPSIEHASGLTADERKAVRGMIAYGVAESTFSRALYEKKGSPTESLSGPKVQLTKDAVSALVLGGLMHSAERISREMMFLTSFRLNQKAGRSFDESVREAVNDTNEALGNYGGYNRPLFMQSAGGKVLTQFQMYPLQVTMFLINNFKQMIAPMDGHTRGEAAIKFFGTMGTTFMLAGAVGLPMFSTIMGLLGVLWRELDDDDMLPMDMKHLSPELWFRTVFLPNQLGDVTIGGKKLSAIMERGPVNALTGLDIGGRTGLDNMWIRDTKEHKNVREEIMAIAVEKAGPGVNMILSLADAYEAFANGDYRKGVEKMLPAGFRNFVLAHKYATEGAKDVKGAQLMSKDSFRTGELIGQSIGFRSDLLANTQYVNFKVQGLEQHIVNERTQLMNNLDRDFAKSNFKEFSGVLKDIQKFNSKFPSYAITEDNIVGSLEKRAEQRATSLKGVVLTEKNVPVFIKSLRPSREELAQREKESRP